MALLDCGLIFNSFKKGKKRELIMDLTKTHIKEPISRPMRWRKFDFLYLLALTMMSGNILAGPFEPPAGQTGSTAVANTDPAIAAWASGVADYQPGLGADPLDPLVQTPFDDPANALGPAEGNSLDIVSLGAGGYIDLTFSGSISNGPGWDIVVFENGFSDTFLELGRVQVSTNGIDFYEFPGLVDPGLAPTGAFGAIDTTDIANTISLVSPSVTINTGIVSKYIQGFGTPLDLEWFVATDLANYPNLDVDDINFVRVIDIVGDGTFTDIAGNPVYDPSPNSSPGGGFDLDGVGVRYIDAAPAPTTVQVPMPASFVLILFILIALIGIKKHRQT